jgi:hypothetical protein
MNAGDDFDLKKCAGCAVIIFALLAGLGACSMGMGIGTYYAERKAP